MPTYRIIGKAHVRATRREEPAVDARGNPYVMIHAGEPVRLEVGSLVRDVTPEELAAFPDRFELTVEEEPSRARHAAAVPEPEAVPESEPPTAAAHARSAGHRGPSATP